MPGDSSRRRSSGRVTLVGAGPGDPDLLTLRGARRLAEADLVLYDALSSDAMRSLAPQARWFYVGKRACRQSIDQDVLNRLMIREAERGFHVVRLKCGDPFVFGRGGEEVLALAKAGVPCEVVPGLSSSVAGPGLLGIPVTHRGASSGFVVVTGHHERIFRPLLESLPQGSLTLVILMGLGQRAAIVDVLRGRGWAASTPAAIVLGAGSPAAWRWTGSLSELGGVALPLESAEAPGILVIGQVVAVAEAWSSLRVEVADVDGSVVGSTLDAPARPSVHSAPMVGGRPSAEKGMPVVSPGVHPGLPPVVSPGLPPVIDAPVAAGADSLARPDKAADDDSVARLAAASGSRILPPS